MTKATKKTARASRGARSRRAVKPAVPAARSARADLRLPWLVAPVTREVRRDPLRARMLASGACQLCFDACGHLPIALQSACRALCATACKL